MLIYVDEHHDAPARACDIWRLLRLSVPTVSELVLTMKRKKWIIITGTMGLVSLLLVVFNSSKIYDVDFTLNPGVDAHPPALANLHWFGLVQYIGSDRMEDWTEFYETLFGFTALPDEQRYGILPKGRILLGPCGGFHLQLIDPKPGIFDIEPQESLQRVGFGTPDVLGAVKTLRQRGIGFVESQDVHSEARGALTAGTGTVGGTAVTIAATDRDVAGGSFGVVESQALSALLQQSRTAGTPVILCLDSAGAR